MPDRSPGGRRQQVVFVQDFALIDCPYDIVAARFCADIPGRLSGALRAARRHSNQLQRKAAPRGWPTLLARTVDIDLGSTRSYEDGLLVSFTWQAHNGSALVPTLDADLQLAPVGSTQTQVTLRGRYRPPAGAVGRYADQLLLHRVADATIRAFVADIAAGLAEPEDPGSGLRPVADPGSPSGSGNTTGCEPASIHVFPRSQQ